jgi:hypothetical protein
VLAVSAAEAFTASMPPLLGVEHKKTFGEF